MPRSKVILTVATALTLVGSTPGAAWAQQPRPRRSSAAPRQEAATVAEGRRHFDQGRAFFDSNNYDAALAEFERAYELLDGRPNRYVLLFNIGQCHERLFRYDEALRYYRRYVTEGGASARDRSAVEATVRTLEGLLATVRVTVNVPHAEVWVDERRVGSAPGEVQIPGGRHVIELRERGYLPARQEVQLPARATRDLAFSLEVVPRGRGVRPVFFWTTAGAAALSAAVGAFFGVRALVMRGDVDSRLADPAGRYEVSDEDRQDIRQSALAADISYGGAALLAVGATVLFFVTDWGRGRADGERTPGARTSLGVAPLAYGGGAGLQLLGGF